MFLAAILLILAAAMSRLILYPVNFSPVIAMALFGGSVIRDKKYAFALPLFAMFISDLLFEVLNIAPGFWGWGQVVSYGILGGITVLGFYLKKRSVGNITLFAVLASLLFFLLSNASVWMFDTTFYKQNLTGLLDCIAAGIPFLKNQLAADLVYSGLLFGGYALVERKLTVRIAS
jgi:hypothetical protein